MQEVETAAAVHELLVALRRDRADLAPDGDPVLHALARDAFLRLSMAEHAARHGMTVTEMSIAAVARGVGYDDQACFSRLFTRRVGRSPLRFREQQARAVPGGWSDRIPAPDNPSPPAPPANARPSS